MNLISPEALSALLSSSSPPLLVDVRLEDDHQAVHLPDSRHNCVFEVGFEDRFAELCPNRQRAIVLYGASAASAEAKMAAEKLSRVDYPNCSILEGGIEAWRNSKQPIETGPALPPAPKNPDGRLPLDLEQCQLEWLGRNLINKHFGTIEITGGHLDFKQGTLTGGEFHFDLRSLKCTDLAGSEIHDVLIHHLQDHDFLDIDHFPDAKLSITSATPAANPTPGSADLTIHAELTLRGVTQPIEFIATPGITAEGHAAAQASFAIDRTRWGIIYGSGRFFDRLAGHLVNDQIEFQARIITR